MIQVVRTQKAEAIAHFQYEGRLIQDVPFGNGHINDTYLLTFEVKRMGILKVILQKMNKNVFKNPVELMENILGVTSYLREKIIKKGDTSSGVDRAGDGKSLGNAAAGGICHSFTADGRCISLLKILFTNECIYDCKYCINRCSNDVRRVTFTPEEVCRLTVEFYRRNYIEGLFLSSGIINSPEYTIGNDRKDITLS